MVLKTASSLKRSSSGRRHRNVLWVVSLVVFLPLLIMVALQYWWLINLKQTSIEARSTYLLNYAKTMSKSAKYFYSEYEVLLQPSAEYFKKPLAAFEWYCRKRTLPLGRVVEGDTMHEPFKGVRFMFTTSFIRKDAKLNVFDVENQKLIPREDVPLDLLRAMELTTLYYEVLAKKGRPGDYSGIKVNRENPDIPIIFYPNTEDGELIGLTGLVANLDFFRDSFLPEMFAEVIPKDEQSSVYLAVYDNNSNRIFEAGCLSQETMEPKVNYMLNFPFTSWWISMSGGNSAYTWAGTNFFFNVGLSLVLALVLAAGIIFALRTASRDMQVSDMKNVFVSNVSHELRTPLASIRVFGELMALGRVTQEDKVKEYGEFIETESRRLTQLINNILDFSKIESGHKKYHLETTDIRDILTRVLRVFEVRLQATDLKLVYKEPRTPPPLTRLDPDAVGQAIFNLVDNAVKYGRDGKIIEIELKVGDKQLFISVKDFGIGIPEEEQDKIFERFHRVGTDLVHDVKGSGLGLSIVSHVAIAHDGDVLVVSEQGKGSTFTLCLPLRMEAGEVTEMEVEPA